jgi:hypothetical protein
MSDRKVLAELCPKCELANLREADPIEFMLTGEMKMKHCDCCGATWQKVTKIFKGPDTWLYCAWLCED